MQWIQSVIGKHCRSIGQALSQGHPAQDNPRIREAVRPNMLANIVHKSPYATLTTFSCDRAGEGSETCGISTISNQYRPSDRVTFTSVSKVTGLTRYMSAPRLR